MSYFSTKKFGQHYLVDSKTKWNIEKVQFLTIPREFQNENMDWSQQVVLTKYFLSKTMMSQLFTFVSKTNKKLWTFSSKYCWYFKNYPSTHFKTDQNIISIEKLPDFDSKEYEICLRWKKCILKQIPLYQNHWISFAIKLLDVDLVLAKISQIDPRLTFNLFHIFNHGRISQIGQKYLVLHTPLHKIAFWEI